MKHPIDSTGPTDHAPPTDRADQADQAAQPSTSSSDRVSRETDLGPRPEVERTPPAAADLFGDRLALAEQYAGLLADQATVRGLIGPGELPRLWTRHLLNCAVLAELVPDGADLVDVGSGAGLPGIVLAIARPDLTVTLVEPLLRRASWLEDAVGQLGLGQVTVRRARAEELSGRLTGTVVTARAVAPMDRLARWCLPLVAPGGELLAMKGQGAAAELAVAAPRLRRMRAVEWSVQPIGADGLADPTSVIRVKVGPNAAPTGRRRAGQRSHPRDRGGES